MKKNYTKKEIIALFKKHCIADCQFGDEGDLNGFTIQVLSDELDYKIMCDILGIDYE